MNLTESAITNLVEALRHYAEVRLIHSELAQYKHDFERSHHFGGEAQLAIELAERLSATRRITVEQ